MADSQRRAVPWLPVLSRYGSGVVELAGRAVELQPAAEAVIQACRIAAGPAADSLLAEGNRVLDQYRGLREELRLLGRGGTLEGELATLLDEHVRVVSRALRTGVDRGAADGLGQAGGRLAAVRDQLRQAEPFQSRAVDDVPTGDRL